MEKKLKGGEVMSFPLTEEQEFAVDTINVNCIVPAGAGSGKTRVLVERYLKIVEEYAVSNPSIIENIVAITFTEKAAKEMMERIRAGMIERREESIHQKDREKAFMWQESIQKLERATVSTIHSFCAKILREYPVESNIDPEFGVFDAMEAEWLLHDVAEKELKKFIEEEQEKGVSPFYQWVSMAGFNRTIKQLIQLYHQISNSGMNFTEVQAFTEGNLTLSPYEFISGWDDLLKAGDELFYVHSESNNKRYHAFIDHWPAMKDAIIRNKENNETVDFLINEMIELTAGNFGQAVKEQRKKVNDLAKSFKESIDAIVYHEFEKEYMLGFFSLLKRIDLTFTKEKEGANGVDFDEMQMRTIKLLKENSEIQRTIQKRISFLMIDEFQDNNQIQKSLISLLLKDSKGEMQPGSLFVVGDPKQSIYRFRGADVHVFKEMEREIKDASGRIAPLIYNFRSDPKIISFVNHFFSMIMTNDPASPNYYKDTIAKRDSLETDAAVEFIPIYQEEDNEKGIRELEAEQIATRIKELIHDGVGAKDITILLRSLSNVNIYEEALLNMGIPYYVIGGRGFYQKQEVFDLINILEYLIDPTNKIALAGILRSPMVGISDDTLYQMMKEEIYQHRYIEWDEFINRLVMLEQEKLKHFMKWMNTITSKIGRVKVYELLEEIIELTQYKPILLAFPRGIQKVANIDKFIRIAKNFSSDNPYSIYEFNQRINRLIEEDQQEKDAAIESEAGNTVKIMSIHQSKGLEFPYVFIPDLSRKPLNDDALIKFNASYGVTCKIPLEDEEWASPLRYITVSRKEKQLEREEAVRLFYVAATRAEKRLILSGKVEDTKGKFEVDDVLQAETWSKWLDVVLNYQEISLEEKKWTYHIKGNHHEYIKVIYYENREASKNPLGNIERFDYNELAATNQEDLTYYTKPLDFGRLPTYSISALKRFEHCPRYYYYTDVLSLYDSIGWLNTEFEFDEDEIVYDKGEESRIRELIPSLKGTLVHELLESITINPQSIETWEEQLKQGMLRSHLSQEILEQEEWKLFMKEAAQYVDNYKDSRFFTENDHKIETEYDFILTLNNGFLRGTIDRLEVNQEDRFTIVDYKTDREIDVEKYKPQILTYALAIMKNFNLQPYKGILYFIRHNQIEELTLSVEQLEDWQEKLELTLDKMNKSTNIEDYQKNTDKCYHCVYSNICTNE